MPVGSYISGTPYIVHSVVMMQWVTISIDDLMFDQLANNPPSRRKLRPYKGNLSHGSDQCIKPLALRHRASGPQFYPWVKDQGWLGVAGPSKLRSRHEALFTWLRRGKLIKLSFGPRKSRNFPRSQKTVLTFFEGNKSVGWIWVSRIYCFHHFDSVLVLR